MKKYEVSASCMSPKTGLDQLLAAMEVDAAQFDFYYVLRRVDAAVPGSAPLGRAVRPIEEPLRLTQHPSLVFAPAALHEYKSGVAAHGLGRLSVHHFGLFGPNGALPQHLTEYVQERMLHSKDDTITRFCDIFQHRMILLFYRAWADCQPVISLDQKDRDNFGRYVSSLVGLGQPSLRDRDCVPDHLKLAHAGHLVRQTRNVQGLVSPLVALLRIPVAIQEYCLQWLRLEDVDQTQLRSVTLAGKGDRHRVELGSSISRLGQGAIAGARVPDVQHKFRLLLGAMTLNEFVRYLPGGIRFLQVRDWVRNYVGVELAWDARLVLKRDEVPATRLGINGHLGWTSWLGMPEGKRQKDADEVLLDMERLSLVRKPAIDSQPGDSVYV
jgi:type VI secretion system protein ImpH